MQSVPEKSGRFRLDGRSAIVTGGASGIGFAIASEFARAGAIVHIVDLTLDSANQAAQRIAEAGGVAKGHACNVSDQAEVNVKSVYHCARACIGPMVEAGGGVILNMASIAASSGLDERFSYSMSKGAVLAMTYSIARDFLKKNIRCNAISPARVHTGFVDGFLAKNYPGKEAEMFERLSAAQPIGRMAKPEEVANLALYLCSDEASFLTGVDYPLDGGFVNLRG